MPASGVRATNRTIQYFESVVKRRLEELLRELLNQPVEITYRERARSSTANAPASVDLFLELGPALGTARIRVDPRLAVSMIAPFVDRTPGLQNPWLGLDDAARGAFAAICIHLLEQLVPEHNARLARALEPLDGEERLGSTFQLDVGHSRYLAEFELSRRALASLPPPISGDSLDLGELLLLVPLVVGWTMLSRSTMSELGLGAVLLPGAGLFVDEKLRGHALLAAPGADRGWEVELVEPGTIVLGKRAVTLKDPNPEPPRESSPDLMDVIAESPLTVRLELGCVSLPARQWALLRPGQILETCIPVGRLVDLRLGNEVVATGELVDVDGCLGVEIRQIGRGKP